MTNSSVEALVKESHTSDPMRQVQALIELIKIHNESVVPSIIDLLESDNEEVRAECARVLGYLGDSERDLVGSSLLRLIDDEDDRVRNEVVEALGLQLYPLALEPLKRILRSDPYWVVRASAAESLGNYGDQSVLADLEQVLQDEDEESIVQAYAAASIGLLADAAFRPRLERYVDVDAPIDVQSDVLAALYRLGGKERLEALLQLLQSADEDDVPSTLNTIKDLTERKYPPTLLADAPRIRQALNVVVQRFPLRWGQVKEIEENLTRLEQEGG